MTREELLRRLKDKEDNFTERKLEGTANSAEIRRAIVAFANSVPEGRSAILFIGVADDGTPIGVGNTDSIQKKVREAAGKDCYPSVRHQCEVLDVDGKGVLAVVVPASNDRPHFSGPAFVRKGAESLVASAEMYEELIASSNAKAGKILRSREQLVTFRQTDLDQWSRHNILYEIECEIEGCDAHVVSLHDISAGRHFSIPLGIVRINQDQTKRRLMLEAIGE